MIRSCSMVLPSEQGLQISLVIEKFWVQSFTALYRVARYTNARYSETPLYPGYYFNHVAYMPLEFLMLTVGIFCNFSLRFSGIFASAGQAISTIHTIDSSASSRVRSGLHAVFLILYSKSYTSFLPGFSMTVPFVHAVLYQTVLSSRKPASFLHSTANTTIIISYHFQLADVTASVLFQTPSHFPSP